MSLEVETSRFFLVSRQHYRLASQSFERTAWNFSVKSSDLHLSSAGPNIGFQCIRVDNSDAVAAFAISLPSQLVISRFSTPHCDAVAIGGERKREEFDAECLNLFGCLDIPQPKSLAIEATSPPSREKITADGEESNN